MKDNRTKRGQALVMITLSLIALCGVTGLAVDLGWSYLVKKGAQKAADAAALAAADQAFAEIGVVSTFFCGSGGVTCTSSTYTCPANPNSTAPISELDSGCLYAKQNGFSTAASSNQNVLIDANITTPPPSAPGIKVHYWATVRVSQQIPQLFSRVLGFDTSLTSARATAAVIDVPADGSIYLIDRQNDPNAIKDPTGTDLDMQGGGSIVANGAVYMASTGGCAGGSACAGLMGGSASVSASLVGLRGTGEFNNPANVTPAPTSGMADSQNFKDPMRSKGQPLPPTSAEAPAPSNACSGTLCGGPVYDAASKTSGLIDGSKSCVTVGPGSYYAADKNGKASGAVITMKGCINFVNSGGGTGGFSHYVFFGGADFTGSGSVITTAPGQYIFAGVQNGGQNNVHVLNVDNAVTIQDQTPTLGGQMTAPSDAGEMFLFTDANYQGGSTQSGLQSLYIPQAVSNCNTCNFVFGDVNIQMGNTAQSQLNLHGLNADPNNGGAALPSSLQSFAPDVFWQDQQNSPLKYDRNGNIVDSTSCGGGGTLDTPCANPNLSPNGTKEVTMAGNDPTTMFTLQATPGLHLYGVLYQPRGSTLNMQGSGNVTTPMVIITGELKMGGSPTVLQPLGAAALAVEQVALVE